MIKISEWINGCVVDKNPYTHLDFAWMIQYQCPICHIDGVAYLKLENTPMENQLELFYCQMSTCQTRWYGRLHYRDPKNIKKAVTRQTADMPVFLNEEYVPQYQPEDKNNLTPLDIDHLYKWRMHYECPVCKRSPPRKEFLFYDNPVYLSANQAMLKKCQYADCGAEFYAIVNPIKKNEKGEWQNEPYHIM